LDCIFLRKEPPFNYDYLSCTYLLDLIDRDVFILNNPTGVRNANEKLSIYNSSSVAPESIVAYRRDLINQALKNSSIKDLVLKRIDQKGGIGVYKSNKRDLYSRSFRDKRILSGASPTVIQKFIHHEKTGDKRVLILDGKILGSFSRLPGRGDFRANMSLGGKARRSQVTARDKFIVRTILPYLKRNGLSFAGIDIIGGFLTEINVTSPAGIPEINDFEGTRLEENVVDFLEKKCRG
jgi:glutathione synthase